MHSAKGGQRANIKEDTSSDHAVPRSLVASEALDVRALAQAAPKAQSEAALAAVAMAKEAAQNMERTRLCDETEVRTKAEVEADEMLASKLALRQALKCLTRLDAAQLKALDSSLKKVRRLHHQPCKARTSSPFLRFLRH